MTSEIGGAGAGSPTKWDPQSSLSKEGGLEKIKTLLQDLEGIIDKGSPDGAAAAKEIIKEILSLLNTLFESGNIGTSDLGSSLEKDLGRII